jgi:hypothetical protein
MPAISHHQRLLDTGWTHTPPGDNYTRYVDTYDLSIHRVLAAKGFGFMWKACRGGEQVMTGSHMTRVGAALDAAAFASVYSERYRGKP